jgi:hypothetical protein
LNHVDRDVTGIYDRSSYVAEKADAIAKLDAMIEGAVKPYLISEAGQPT